MSQPHVSADRQTVAVPDPMAIDPVVRARVEAASTIAFEQGFTEGMATGRREAYHEAEQVAELIRGAASDAAVRLSEARAMRSNEVVDLALAIAQHLLAREPHDGGLALLERVRGALEQLDDEPLRVSVHPDDVPVIERGIANANALRVQVVADEYLQPGEARVEGPWSRADLTFQGAIEIVRGVLGA